MKSYVVSNVRFDVPDDYIAGRYVPYPPDPDEPYSGVYLNDAVVIYPLRRLPKAIREEYSESTELVPDIPECDAVRLFTSYGKDQLDFGESRRDVAGRSVYRSEIYDVWGSGYICFRVFVLRTKMVEVHVPMGNKQRTWYPLISSLTSTRASS